MKVYTIWAEWDLGINNNIYATYELAVADLEEAIHENTSYTFKEAQNLGLVKVYSRTVMETLE